MKRVERKIRDFIRKSGPEIGVLCSVAAVLAYAVFSAGKLSQKASDASSPANSRYLQHRKTHERSHWYEELAQLDSPEYIYRYIKRVIKYGSNQLAFPGGEMEGGYASSSDIPKIACYVMELGGHKCPDRYPKDAAMFFTSICGGCHGDDGRGLGGTYPDLTRKTLLGIEKRREFLKSRLEKEKRKTR
jgi:cytochrome c553